MVDSKGVQGRRASAASRPSSPQRKSLKSKLSRYESATKFYCYELPATPSVARRTQNFVQKAFLFVTFCYQLAENLSSLCLSVRIQISIPCVVIKRVHKISCLTFCVSDDQFYVRVLFTFSHKCYNAEKTSFVLHYSKLIATFRLISKLFTGSKLQCR